MFHRTVDQQTELRLIDRQQSEDLFKLVDSNREHLRRWHPWVNLLHSVADAEGTITAWQQLHATKRVVFAAIWFKGRFCGMINYQHVDWSNRWAALSYWLNAAHQGQGIMTACCRAMIWHGFNAFNLNRITIECATENTRSRAIPERLGFKLEGIVRGIEWLQDHYVDHAMYGLLRSEHVNNHRFQARENLAPEPRRAGGGSSFGGTPERQPTEADACLTRVN